MRGNAGGITRIREQRRQSWRHRPGADDQQLGRMHLLWLVGVAAVILIGVVLPRRRR
jgi:hypothetical protein